MCRALVLLQCDPAQPRGEAWLPSTAYTLQSPRLLLPHGLQAHLHRPPTAPSASLRRTARGGAVSPGRVNTKYSASKPVSCYDLPWLTFPWVSHPPEFQPLPGLYTQPSTNREFIHPCRHNETSKLRAGAQMRKVMCQSRGRLGHCNETPKQSGLNQVIESSFSSEPK